MTEPVQPRVRCVIMRGGTSKGLYFHEADLPRPDLTVTPSCYV